MAKDQDQSMEEILQSIKRIIAEEGEPAPSGSDVLELTELLSDDDAGTQSNGRAGIGSLSIEEIMAAPVDPEHKQPEPITASEEPAVAEPAAPLEAVAPAPTPQPVAPAVAAPVTEQPVAMRDDEGLVSDTTLANSVAALAALRSIPQAPLPPMPASGMHFRSGQTIEDLVLEALRPMLKEWLDDHLSKMVERLVEKEIRRLSVR